MRPAIRSSLWASTHLTLGPRRPLTTDYARAPMLFSGLANPIQLSKNRRRVAPTGSRLYRRLLTGLRPIQTTAATFRMASFMSRKIYTNIYIFYKFRYHARLAAVRSPIGAKYL